MKTINCLLLAIIISLTSFSQNLHLNLSAGALNYSGDLQLKKYTFNQAHPAFAIGLSYELSEKFMIRSQFMTGKISGDDKLNPLTAIRNLNFTTSVTELQVAAEYYLRDLSEYSLSPYFFAGLAAYHFNPYTKDTSGTKYFLQPLGTEGQGFYNNRQPYKLTQFAVPFGGGMKLALSENIRAGIEFGIRKLFTDHLDDVSTTYVDPAQLAANNGPKAVELAYRTNELKNSIPYPTGDNRGSAKFKDWYYFTGATLSIRLGNKYADRGHSRLGCPAKI